MGLPQLLLQIAGRVAAGIGWTGPERRKSKRSPFGSQGVIFQLTGGPGAPRLVSVRDVSPDGICIINEHEMQKGDEFLAGLPRAKSTPILVHCVVVRCDPNDAGMFDVGATVKRVLED